MFTVFLVMVIFFSHMLMVRQKRKPWLFPITCFELIKEQVPGQDFVLFSVPAKAVLAERTYVVASMFPSFLGRFLWSFFIPVAFPFYV